MRDIFVFCQTFCVMQKWLDGQKRQVEQSQHIKPTTTKLFTKVTVVTDTKWINLPTNNAGPCRVEHRQGTPDEGLNQRYLKYVLAVLKSLGVRVNFWSCSEGRKPPVLKAEKISSLIWLEWLSSDWFTGMFFSYLSFPFSILFGQQDWLPQCWLHTRVPPLEVALVY
jgi:hypothetical protein